MRNNVSWCIYSNTRDVSDEENSGIVLRYCEWDKESDSRTIKSTRREEREALLHKWPKLFSKIIYFDNKHKKDLCTLIKRIDEVLSKGVVPVPRENDDYCLNDSIYEMEIRRLFDWGSIHSIWNITMENKLFEDELDEYLDVLKNAIATTAAEIHQIELDYIIPPEVHKYHVCNIPTN